jgi:hypothetical protein
MQHNVTTTAFELDGYKVTRGLGIVRGIVVRSRSVIGTFVAGLQTLVGGNITMYTNLCDQTREEAYNLSSPTPSRWAGTPWWASAMTPPRSCRV